MSQTQPTYIVGDWSHIFEGERSDRPTRIVIDAQANKLINLEILSDRNDAESYRLPTRLEFEDVSDSILNGNAEVFDRPADFGLTTTDELPDWSPYPSFSHGGELWSFDEDQLAIWYEDEAEFHFHSYHCLSEPTVESVIGFIEHL
jgi:hypothetical protein